MKQCITVDEQIALLKNQGYRRKRGALDGVSWV